MHTPSDDARYMREVITLRDPEELDLWGRPRPADPPEAKTYRTYEPAANGVPPLADFGEIHTPVTQVNCLRGRNPHFSYPPHENWRIGVIMALKILPPELDSPDRRRRPSAGSSALGRSL